MATAETRLLTAEEFYDWAHRPENRDRHFELEDGEIVEMSRPGERHSAVCANISYFLGAYVREIRRGYVGSNDGGLILKRDPDTVRGPDLYLYLESKKFEDLNLKYSANPPDLVVEVVSPNDKRPKIMKRINAFLDRGVNIAWLVEPDDMSVEIYRTNKPVVVLEVTEVLENLDELPSLRIPVAELFRMPGESPA